MRKFLVVNADDFGLHGSVSSGIEKAARKGLVTSISCVSNIPEAAGQIRRISADKRLGIGIHLNITDGSPLSDPSGLEFLVDGRGSFKGSHIKAAAAVIFNRGGLLKIREEFRMQIEKLLDLGVRITHIDSHGHIHMLPGIFDLTLDLAKRYKINFIRCPAEFGRFWLRPEFFPVNILGKLNKVYLKRAGIRRADHVIGWERPGRMNADGLRGILLSLKPGINELIVHLGDNDPLISADLRWGYSWQEELLALMDEATAALINNRKIELVNFSAIP